MSKFIENKFFYHFSSKKLCLHFTFLLPRFHVVNNVLREVYPRVHFRQNQLEKEVITVYGRGSKKVTVIHQIYGIYFNSGSAVYSSFLNSYNDP